jgi:hypothetical protein
MAGKSVLSPPREFLHMLLSTEAQKIVSRTAGRKKKGEKKNSFQQIHALQTSLTRLCQNSLFFGGRDSRFAGFLSLAMRESDHF